MNFIDWNNEYETVLDADPYSYESPIHGMSNEVYQQIMDEEFADHESEAINEQVIQTLKTKKVTV